MPIILLDFSSYPNIITPPFVLANAEYVSQNVFGSLLPHLLNSISIPSPEFIISIIFFIISPFYLF